MVGKILCFLGLHKLIETRHPRGIIVKRCSRCLYFEIENKLL